MSDHRSLLLKLGLSETEATIYITLLAYGALTAQETLLRIGGKRPTVYYALRQLVSRGLVSNVASHGSHRFQAAPPSALVSLVGMKRQELESLGDELTHELPHFQIANGTSLKPIITFVEGVAAMKQAVMDTLYIRSRHIDILTPKDNFFWQVGQPFAQSYIDERVQRKITTRNLWEESLKPELLTRSYQGLSTIRILPKAMHGTFASTVFIFDQTVMYISSIKAANILRVDSEEHASLMRSMFEGIWLSSTELTTKQKKK